jgi:hypothetical protein
MLEFKYIIDNILMSLGWGGTFLRKSVTLPMEETAPLPVDIFLTLVMLSISKKTK